MDGHFSTDEQTLDERDHNDYDYSPPTPHSIAAAKAAQARERAAFTKSTGVRLRDDGTTDRASLERAARRHSS